MRTTVIIGASSGVGAAIAAQRCLAGERVLAVARRAERLDALAAAHAGLVPCVYDIADLDGIKDLFARIVREHGPIHNVVYCAGRQYIAPLRGVDLAKVEDLFRVNVLGALAVLQAFASKRINAGDGAGAAFVAVSSVAADRPERGIVAYGASKAALNALIKGAALECAPLRVNAIAPGFMRTEMTQAQAHVYSDGFVDQLAARAPLGLVAPEQVAALADFLLSAQASHMTGQVLTLDGGATLA